MSNPGKKTARELIAAKQQAVSKAPAATPKAAAVARADNREYRQRYLDEVAPSGIVGRMVKFSKDGNFVTHDDAEEMPHNAEFAVLVEETLVGWVKFAGDGELPEREMGLLYDGYQMPPRESLGDTDESKWELGLDGQPADPWRHHQYVVLQNTDTLELFTFVTASKTGRRAVGLLLRHYDRMRKTHPGEVPVVQLRTGGFHHRDDRVGFVTTPAFVVIGRRPADSVAKPDTSIAAFIDDKLPPQLL